MKVVKIKTKITLDSGVDVAAGSIVVPVEVYVKTEADKDGNCAAQYGVKVYASEAAKTAGKKPLKGVVEFDSLIQTNVSLLDYTSKDADTLAAQAIKAFLVPFYTDLNLSIINI